MHAIDVGDVRPDYVGEEFPNARLCLGGRDRRFKVAPVVLSEPLEDGPNPLVAHPVVSVLTGSGAGRVADLNHHQPPLVASPEPAFGRVEDCVAGHLGSGIQFP